MATISSGQSETRTVLYGVSWESYNEMRDEPDNYHLHMTYNKGTLEIKSRSARHEGFAYIIGLIVNAWTEELNVPIRGLRELTCKRADLKKGLEPDNCYYVQNEPQMWDKEEVDFAVDPPPDLAIEVEISRSSVEKMPIYSALGVGELWRYDGQILRIYGLVEGQYQSRETSGCFPAFPVAKAEEVLRQLGKVRETTLLRSFRQWVRETFAGGQTPQA